MTDPQPLTANGSIEDVVSLLSRPYPDIVAALTIARWLAARSTPSGSGANVVEKPTSSVSIPSDGGLDVGRLALALDAPGVFEDPLDDALGLAEAVAREYAALDAATPTPASAPAGVDRSHTEKGDTDAP